MRSKRFYVSASIFLMGLAVWGQTPKADVLDLVFNEDGTVMDVSPMQNVVRVNGVPEIVRSARYDMNVLCQSEEKWGETTSHYVCVPYTETLTAALQDGMTMEVLARPYFQGGKMNGNWVNAFGSFQDAGFGIIIYDGVWDFESHIGGGYKDATHQGPVVADEWVHLVGVWNKEEGVVQLYVDGQLSSTVSGADGDLRLAQGDDPFIGIGVDYSAANRSEALFQGDIAIARIYDRPLSDTEVAAVYQDVVSHQTAEAEHREDDFTFRTDEDGTVLIANTEELMTFGKAVRMGHTRLNAKLEADIDFSASRKMLSNINSYSGTFDGQGHTVTIDLSSDTRYIALFEHLSGATIKNLTVNGNIETDQKCAAGVAACTHGNTTLSHVTSNVAIISRVDGDGTHGGLVASQEGELQMENCLFTGSITGETTHSCAGLVGWTSGNTVISNSLVVAELNTNEEDCDALGRNPSRVWVRNSYFASPYGNTDNGAVQLDEDQLANGEGCWLLNGNKLTATAWHQTLGIDPYPTLNPDHGIVVSTGNNYMSIQDEVSLKEAQTAYTAYIRERAEEMEDVYKPLVEQLLNQVTALETVSSVTDFTAVGEQIETSLTLIRKNREAYARFIAEAEDAQQKIQGLFNSSAEQLSTYLEEIISPNELYPQGSYIYIYDNRTLDTEGIDAQIDYIRDMVSKSIAGGSPAGTDITSLLANADFARNDEGWMGTPASDYTHSPHAGQYYGETDGIKYQTLTGLANGLYELEMNGLDMVGDDNHCSFYTACIFAGNMEMPVMSPMEDALPVEDAVDGTNCYLSTDRLVEDRYYIPYTREGGAIAMNSGGRYLNRVMVNVTDGKLTLGLRLDGSGRNDDWFIFANTKLFYQGSLEEAGEALDNVLACAVARAQTTIDYTADATGNRYLIFPNYEASLRHRLQNTMERVIPTATAVEKYALLEQFSDLFKQIYASRKAYRDCAISLNNYFSRMDDYPDYADVIQEQANQAWEDWNNGVYTAEEAIRKGKDLLAEMDGYAVDVPQADLIDLVFHADGTAADVSASHNEVDAVGAPYILESNRLKMNVCCNYQNTWGENPRHYFRAHISDEVHSGIADGLTMEVLARPHWEGDAMPGGWVSLFGMEQKGGVGMLVYGGKWAFEISVDGYRDAYSVTSPVKGEWVHLVGVWNPTERTVSLYVNGVLNGEVANVDGTYRAPNVMKTWFGVGCDTDGNDQGEHAFRGDIAIARIYNEPINASQAAVLYKRVKDTMVEAEEHEELPDAIHPVTAATEQPATGLYNLMGQRVQRIGKGLYIRNGKKILY